MVSAFFFTFIGKILSANESDIIFINLPEIYSTT